MLKKLKLLCQYMLHMKPTISFYSVIQQFQKYHIFVFYVFYCNLNGKDHIRRIMISKKINIYV